MRDDTAYYLAHRVMATGVGSTVYESRLNSFNEGLRNTTQAINQYSAAFQDAQRIARDKTKSAAEKAEAARQAMLSQVSGFGSGIEGFANSYTNGIDHLNEVRHGFVQRNYVAKSGKLIAQQIQNLKDGLGDNVDPRVLSANVLDKGRSWKMVLDKARSVEDGAAHVVGSEGGVLSDISHGGAGATGITDVGSEIADGARTATQGFPTFSRSQALQDMGYDREGAGDLISSLFKPGPGDAAQLDRVSEMINSSRAAPVDGAARPVVAQTLGAEPDVSLGEETSKIGSTIGKAGGDAAKGLGEGAKIAEGLDDVLPEVDELAATTAEVPIVGATIGTIGGLIQLGTAIASAFGGGEGSSKPAGPKIDTADDGEVQNFSAGQVGGDFSVSGSGR